MNMTSFPALEVRDQHYAQTQLGKDFYLHLSGIDLVWNTGQSNSIFMGNQISSYPINDAACFKG